MDFFAQRHEASGMINIYLYHIKINIDKDKKKTTSLELFVF